MKNLALFLFSLVSIMDIHGQNTIKTKNYEGRSQVNVDVQKLHDKKGKFYLETQTFLDSSIVINGHLHFNNEIKEPMVAKLFFISEKDSSGDLYPRLKDKYEFYLVPRSINITSKDSITGSVIINETELQKQYREIRKQERDYTRNNLSPLYYAFKDADKKGQDKLADSIAIRFDVVKDSLNQNIIIPFIVANLKKSPVALTYLESLAEDRFSYKTIQPLFAQLSSSFQSLPTGVALKNRLHFALITDIGQQAPDFVQNDTLGNPVRLSDFKGKYVLIDFWASWCGPCRAENPNVIAAYNKYKDRNFTVLGISFDQSKEKWLNAINTDHLTWTQVSDLKSWGNQVGKLYGIQSIPQNFLIGPDGKIIGKNLRGEHLMKKLASIFN